MKVLLLIDSLGAGGAETHIVTLATALVQQGLSVTVVSSGGVLEKQLCAVGVKVLRFPHSPAGPFGMLCGAAYLSRLCRAQRFDIWHAHTRRTALLVRLLRLLPPPPLPSKTPYRRRSLRRLARPVTVVTAHARFSPRPRRLCFWGDATVAVSEDLAAHTSLVFGVPRERIRIIPNGIDINRFRPPDRPRADRVLRVAFASRLDDDCSDAAYALLALAPSWQAKARAIGYELTVSVIGGGTNLEALRKRAASLPFVQLCGECERIEDHLKNADIFVGVSRAALEAAACGCAVILAGNEGFGGVLNEYTFDRFAEENFCCRSSGALSRPSLRTALDKAFLSLLALPATQRQQSVSLVRQKITNRYSADHMARDTAALYRERLTERRRLRILVGGYAGCGNLGDDAILRALVARWQNKPAPATLLSSEPLPFVDTTLTVQALTGPHHDSFSFVCYDRRRPYKPLRHADAFVLGGGALLQNCSSHGMLSLVYYLGLALAARLGGCPWYIVAGGVGPLHGALARTAVRAVTRTAYDISVRDEPSRALLCSLGWDRARVRVEDDPVLSVRPCSSEQAKCELARILGRPAPLRLLCIAPRGATAPEPPESLVRFCRREGMFPLFFAFDAIEDTPICRQWQEHCGGAVIPLHTLTKKGPPERLVAGIFALSCGVIAGRLHALILASLSSTPALALPQHSQDPKLAVFAAAHGQYLWRGEGIDACFLGKIEKKKTKE